ncbi:NTP transferase domain-containing protein [Myxococcota bacterium]|nr:NTP transferase domain-containing protein [Myxococcota bacterium]
MGVATLDEVPVMILAGGLGTRLASVLPNVPKGLADVAGRSFLELQIDLLRRAGARRFVLCVGHLASQIRSVLGDGRQLGVSIEYSVEDPARLLGTAGAILNAFGFIESRALVLNGDTYFDIDYAGFVARHVERCARAETIATLAVAQVEDASDFGTVVLSGAGTRVVEFREKESSRAGRAGLVNAGAYMVEAELLKSIEDSIPQSLEHDVLPRALSEGGEIASEVFEESFYDIGTPRSLARFLEWYDSTVRPQPS